MLIVDFHTLEAVYTLYFLEHVILHRTDTLDFQDIMGVDASFCQLIAGFQHLAVQYLDSGSVRDQIGLGIAGLIVGYRNLALLLGILNLHHAAKLGNDGKTLWLTGLKKLLHTGKTLCDVAAGHAARMERTHGKLCTRLTDGLCRDDTDSLAHLYRLACRHVGAVTLGAHTDMGLTAEDGTNLHRLASCLIQHLHNSCGALRCTHMVSLNHNLSCIRVSDGLSDIASCDSLFQVLDDFISIHKGLDFHKWDIPALAAVHFTDNQIL